ncbi:MAG: 2,3-bisphosphoglycerate-independent phosphoglycerate mutase [Parcubacteria group bacterium]|nr:2,3-bisphosphoglycerate-independent phosphoglycerate mutase [Parcubacteria group bacterium]
MRTEKTVLLVVMDGWGVGPARMGNAITQAETPVVDAIERTYPFTTLQASGIAVGLPWGESGNSETGHLTIGTGRIMFQHLPRITLAIQDGSFYQNPVLIGACGNVHRHRSRFHIMGLISSGSVHSYIDHLYGLLDLLKRESVSDVFIHTFTDGRDAPPKEGKRMMAHIDERLRELGIGSIVTLIGRSFALDRDQHWEKTQAAYECLTSGKGENADTVASAFDRYYAEGITDEFVPPTIIQSANDTRIQQNDSVFFLDYREDSVRQLSRAFIDPVFAEFPRPRITPLYFATMTEYQKGLPAHVAFPPTTITYTLGDVLADRNLRQLRIAESDKYAHVTYFFNGGRETPLTGEERILIPSDPAPHFDLKPEMKAGEITDRAVAALASHDYAFILVNFANADMVGHTGNLAATIRAVEVVDRALGKLTKAVLDSGAILLITGDHGNAEEKIDPYTGDVRTEHTVNPVPFYLVSKKHTQEKTAELVERKKIEVSGLLTDIAPTILDLMGIEKPVVMTGKSLLPILGVTR